MIAFLFRRIAQAIPTLLGITLLIFTLFQWVGGNPVYRMLGKNATAQELDRLTRQLGLDKPLWSQYLDYVGSLFHWDFGRSWETKQRVSEMILDGLGPSLSLVLPAFVLATLASLAVALTAALYHNRWPDRLLVVLAVCGMSLSVLAFIIAAQYLLAFRAGWFPISGWEPGFEGIPFLVLPVLIWVAAQLGANMRFYRAVFVEEMRKEYVVAARAKGLTWPRVLVRHVLPNAMIPILTQWVMELPMLFTGSLLLESFFGVPGLGHMSVNAIYASDLPVIKAMTFIGSILYLAANILGDALYARFDPRVRVA
jgi:peptide/nickel transport system permease protein